MRMKDTQSAKANHSRMINVPCRYYRVYTDLDVPCEERNFRFVERRLPIPVKEAALVLVDVWATHYIDSWLARAKRVIQSKIVPLLGAARKAGMTIIHAPSPYITQRYYQEALPKTSAPPPSGPAWPPPGFRGIYRKGEYAAFGRDQEPRLPKAYAHYETEQRIADPALPLPGEIVITTGDQMHEILAQRKILHLFYCGFATNWCVIGRDYGIIRMNERGYNIILVRDATTGIEFHDTVDALAATEMTVREIETKYAWSCRTDAFVKACVKAKE